jgi:hypothetical protein
VHTSRLETERDIEAAQATAREAQVTLLSHSLFYQSIFGIGKELMDLAAQARAKSGLGLAEDDPILISGAS